MNIEFIKACGFRCVRKNKVYSKIVDNLKYKLLIHHTVFYRLTIYSKLRNKWIYKLHTDLLTQLLLKNKLVSMFNNDLRKHKIKKLLNESDKKI